MGLPPRRLLGWEPRTWSTTLPDGRVETVREPEWDWADRIIVTEWLTLSERLCPKCGRPVALHLAEAKEQADAGAVDPVEAAAMNNYGSAFLTCPATVALDHAQVAQDDADKDARKKGLDPERARHWMTTRFDEPLPRFD